MRINNNLMAMNTHRQLGAANAAGAKSMEKLSSGYRINRAGDDAAGLAISEKMRGQIRGLNQASSNSQDAISLIQTTEGALNETHAILQRMRELTVQSATDTNTSADRENIQDEIDELATEITRISTDTEFNTMKVLDGNFKDRKFHIGSNEDQNITFGIDDMGAKALGVQGTGKLYKADKGAGDLSGLEITSKDGTIYTITFEDLGDKDAGAKTAGAVLDKENNKITITLEQEAGDTTDPGAVKSTVDEVANLIRNLDGVEGIEVKVIGIGSTVLSSKPDDITMAGVEETDPEKVAAHNAGKGLDVTTQDTANKAITTVNSALEKVSKQRSKLGAVQNRLEHTIKNLDASAENLQASESRIRDVDMAKEMMQHTRNNILQQASTAMLAQANMAPQSVLQLLG